MIKRVILVAPALLLSAASADETSYVIQPGYWETTTRFTSVEAPGMPAEGLALIRSHIANNPDISHRCITPAEAADPTARLMADERPGCEFSERTFAEGRIRISGVCPGPSDQGRVGLTWEGGFTYTTMTGAITTEVTGTEQDMRMSGTVDSRRISDCPDSSELEER